MATNPWADLGLGTDEEAAATVSSSASYQEFSEAVQDASPVDDWSERMSEVERRLVKAGYYRSFIQGGLFEGSDPAATEVEAEFRAWAREQLEVLLNIAAPKSVVAAQFDDVEVAVLKELVGEVRRRKLLKTTASSPVTATSQVPPPPKPAPVAKPAIRKRPVEAPKGVTAVAKPVAQAPQGPGAKRTSYTDGEVIQESGKRYKVKLIQIQGPEEIPPGIEGFERAGAWWKVVKSELVKRPKATGAVPMPTAAQVSAISAQKAMEGAAILDQSSVTSRLLPHLIPK